MKPITKSQLLKMLRSSDPLEENKALKSLYTSCYPKIRHYVVTNSGNEEDAKDLFQEVLQTAWTHIKEGRKITVQLCTYLYAIAKNSWLNKLRRNKFKGELPDEQEMKNWTTEEDILQKLQEDETAQKLKFALERLGEVCRRILILRYAQGWTSNDIAEDLGYGSGQVIRNKLGSCKQKLLDLLPSKNTL